MISLIFSLALLNPGTPVSLQAERPLPAAPVGHVLDRMEWLHEDTRLHLEEELGRLRTEHGIGITVVVWDRRLPDGESPADYANRLGTEWNRAPLWGIVLLTPGSIDRPAVACGGTNLTDAEREHLASAAAWAVDYGVKAWTDQDRLRETSLLLAEELTFARHVADATTGSLTAVMPNATGASAEDRLRLGMLLGGTVCAVLAAILLLIRLSRNQPQPESAAPASHAIPESRSFAVPNHPARLGAPWSGGRALVVALPSPPSA